MASASASTCACAILLSISLASGSERRNNWGRPQPFVYSSESDICADSTGLDFSHASVVHSNLGGKGPHIFRNGARVAQEIRLRNVAMVNGKSVDCVITNTSEYHPFFASLNKMRGKLAQVNLRAGTSVDLKFSFIDGVDGTPVMIPRFYFSVLDLDAGWHGAGAEWIKLDSYQAHYISKPSTVSATTPTGGSGTRFLGNGRGRYHDNRFPDDAMDLSQSQAERTVAFLFTYASEFPVTFGSRRDARWYWNILSRNILFGGKSAVTCNANSGVKPLSKHDFSETYLINWPGTYLLTEDIDFQPDTSSPEVTAEGFPMPDSDKFPQLGGFFLGFFAAVVIQAPNVTFDCQGHSIGMSVEFHRMQRFFAIFELASKPFISAAGPPQFTNGLLSPGKPYSAANVTIQNCVLGRSSHHGIHGNENRGVTLKNLRIHDFEVAGVHLNGASGVAFENVDIGPSMQNTYSAELSHAIFLDHLMNTLLLHNSPLYQARMTTNIVLRGETSTVDTIFNSLHSELRQFIQDRTGALASLFTLATGLPDGSAVYGIVLHKTGPAVHEFGACGAFEALQNGVYEKDVALRDVTIHDLHVDVEQWTRLILEGKQVMGPAGDVFRMVDVLDEKSQYVGDLLSDAQLAVGALKKQLVSDGLGPDETSYYFGGVHIPDSVLTWASGMWTDEQAKQWVDDLVNENSFQCFGDAMSHFNKGAVGLRVAYISGIELQNVSIRSISNEGRDDADPAFCSGPYLGKDVYGAVFENIEDELDTNSQEALIVDVASLSSKHGGTVTAVKLISTKKRRLSLIGLRADDVMFSSEAFLV